MKSREWLKIAATLESDVSPLAGGNAVTKPAKSPGGLPEKFFMPRPSVEGPPETTEVDKLHTSRSKYSANR